MGILAGVWWGVVAGVITTLVTFAAGSSYRLIRLRRRLGHLERVVPSNRRVQIVLPSTEVTDFIVKGETTVASFPPNVLIMPMPEGMAIARLTSALHSIHRAVSVTFTTDESVSQDFGLTISVGGPSVNEETRRLLSLHPDFSIHYPEHIASVKRDIFRPAKRSNGEIKEDWGFVIIARSDRSVSIVLCGVWGTGTEAAVKGLLQKRPKRLVQAIKGESRVILCYRITIEGLRSSEPTLVLAATPTATTIWG